MAGAQHLAPVNPFGIANPFPARNNTAIYIISLGLKNVITGLLFRLFGEVYQNPLFFTLLCIEAYKTNKIP
jgi:hypothetical protein